MAILLDLAIVPNVTAYILFLAGFIPVQKSILTDDFIAVSGTYEIDARDFLNSLEIWFIRQISGWYYPHYLELKLVPV